MGALWVGRHPSGVRGVASPVGFCSEIVSSLVASSAFRVTLRGGALTTRGVLRVAEGLQAAQNSRSGAGRGWVGCSPHGPNSQARVTSPM